MRIDDRLAKMNREKNRKKPPPDEEDTLTYAERTRQADLNKSKGAFETKTWEGINTRENVFDRTAVFRP